MKKSSLGSVTEVNLEVDFVSSNFRVSERPKWVATSFGRVKQCTVKGPRS